MVTCGHAQSGKNLSHLMFIFPAEVKQGSILPSCFSSHTVNKYPFCDLFSATFFTFKNFLLVISLFRKVPKCSVEVLSSVPQCKKAVMCLTEKIRVK